MALGGAAARNAASTGQTMNETHEIAEPDAGAAPAAVEEVRKGSLSSASTCLSCGAPVLGPYCAGCGQKNDDMRRSSVILLIEFMRDAFGFDSRVWRTIGPMAAAPGSVPADYAQGRRSRYTPPIRFFLATSFLFFVLLASTHTLFVAIEVTRKSEAEIAADAADNAQRLAAARERIAAAGRAEAARALDSVATSVDEAGAGTAAAGSVSCPLNFKVKFFVRPADAPADLEAWRECADSLVNNARIAVDAESDDARSPAEREAEGRAMMQRALAGITAVVESPERFNREINDWLARVMFVMAPILALLIAVFIRGPDALLFDHMVLSLYLHAFAFAAVGAAVIAAMAGAPHAGLAVAIAIGLYLFVALKRAYRRGWIKTTLATAFAAFAYLLLLSSAATAIVLRTVWTGA
jgi:hypothetical protein